MAGYIEVVLPNGDVAGVTVESKGYRKRLWTSYKGIGYLGSYYGKSLRVDPNGEIVDKSGDRYTVYKRAGVAGAKFNGKEINSGDIMVSGPKDATKKLFAVFLAA